MQLHESAMSLVFTIGSSKKWSYYTEQYSLALEWLPQGKRKEYIKGIKNQTPEINKNFLVKISSGLFAIKKMEEDRICGKKHEEK